MSLSPIFSISHALKTQETQLVFPQIWEEVWNKTQREEQ